MDERIYHWLSDYAAMLTVQLAISKCSVPTVDEAVRKTVKEVNDYLRTWRLTPPDSAETESGK